MRDVPSLGLLPYRPRRARRYLYSGQEIQQLMQASKTRPSCDPLRPWTSSTYYCLFGLLAVTGLRLSEALNLRVEDLDGSDTAKAVLWTTLLLLRFARPLSLRY